MRDVVSQAAGNRKREEKEGRRRRRRTKQETQRKGDDRIHMVELVFFTSWTERGRWRERLEEERELKSQKGVREKQLEA